MAHLWYGVTGTNLTLTTMTAIIVIFYNATLIIVLPITRITIDSFGACDNLVIIVPRRQMAARI
jgi:hypothetical protein